MKHKSYWLNISYASFFVIGIPLTIMTAIWPNIASNIHTNISNVAIVSGVALIINAFALTLSSVILTKIGARVTMALGIFIQSISFIIMIFAYSLPMCVFSALVQGFGSGLTDTSANYFVTVNYKAKNTVWLHAFWSMGSGIGPLAMAAVLAKGYTYNQGYVMFFPVFFILALIIFVSRMIEKKELVETGEIANVKGPVKFKFIDILKTKNSLLFFVGIFFADFLQCEITIWFSSFVVGEYGLSDVLAANMLTFFFLGVTIARILGGIIVEKLGISRVIVLSIITFIVASVLLALNSKSIMLLYVAIFFFGVGVGPLFPFFINYSKLIFHEEVLQGVIGLSGSAAQIGALVASALIGFLVNMFSIHSFIYVVFMSGIIAFANFCVLERRRNSK